MTTPVDEPGRTGARASAVRPAVAWLFAAALAAGCTDDARPPAPSESPASAAPDAAPERAGVPARTERHAYFGDLHLHTAYSFDAAASGTATTPDDAYRYARGEPVEYLGRRVQRNAPLDFLAVTDHSEYLAIAVQAADPNGRFGRTEWPDRMAAVKDDTLAYMQTFSRSAFAGVAPAIPEFVDPGLIRSNWQLEIEAAERHYRPGEFTTFVAYEWSPMPGGAHLHRNVIFRGPGYPEAPFSSLDSPRPEDLWTFAEALRDDGIDSVLIPHNPNLSRGRMFAPTDSSGGPITQRYAERRTRNERLVEIAQIKGTSETVPEYSAPDEFADFEILRLPAEADTDRAGGYVRPALARGLELAETIGINPFKFGLIGSSDFHSGVSATEEDNYPGGLGRSDDAANAEDVLTEINPISRTTATVFSAGALTGLWAEENTRESLFAALKRREAFATSGTRVRLRLFAGWDFEPGLTSARDWPARAYEAGFPMGADLPSRRGEEPAPLRLLVQAAKDPAGANLDRIQIVKIWRENGAAREAVYDVAWSGGRTPRRSDGRLPPVGNTVDVTTATFTNTIGTAELHGEWVDPAFDPDVPAIYYARVLEIPTPRWSTYLAARNGLELSDDVPATIQERAWTSPVFYEP